MKKIYYSLFFLSLASIVTAIYLAVKNTNSFINEEQTTSTSTPVAILKKDQKEYITKTGRTILVENTHPLGESLSTITITTKEFTGSSSPIIIEKDRLIDTFVNDLDHDGYDEIYFVTQAAGSGSYANIVGYASDKDIDLVPVTVPEIQEEDMAQGNFFEGYIGHDTITTKGTMIVRSFPFESFPSNLTKEVAYSLTKVNKKYVLSTLSKKEGTPDATSTVALQSTIYDKPFVWKETVTSTGTKILPKKQGSFILTLSKSLMMTSKTDCNAISGAFTINSNSLTFSNLASTKMYCEGSDETLYNKELTDTVSFATTTNELHLLLKNKDKMIFTSK